MNIPTKIARFLVRKTRATGQSIFLAYPKQVQCNICGWEGRHFVSDAWHFQINCPICRSGVRQRLFFAALQNTERFSFEAVLNNKAILHFAPEAVLSPKIREHALRYATADF